MNTYLLLRDNKESGPYSFDELRQKGLKPYDLVWIDGRSAAWRYPSEVEELMPFAPAVEEQPFDRFFKRPAQNNSTVSATLQPLSAIAQAVPAAVQPVPATAQSLAVNGSGMNGEPSTVPGKRIIYVTLPANRAIPVTRQPHSSNEPARTQSIAQSGQAISATREIKEPVRIPTPAVVTPSLYAQPESIGEEKFSQGQEDLWKNTVEITPRQQASTLRRIMQPVAAIVCILALLAAGIFIGLSINKDSFGFSKSAGSKETALTPAAHIERVIPAAVPVNNEPSSVDPSSVQATQTSAPVTQEATPLTQTSTPVTGPAPTNAKTINPQPSNPVATLPTIGAKPLAAASAPPVTKKKAPKDKQALIAGRAPGPTLVRDSTANGFPVVRREATHRTDATPDKDAVKNNIANLLSIGANTYTVGTFGGISDLELTVSNRSIYPIDLVVVEVQYVQANKKVYKTENIYFRGISPGSASMLEAPKSTRGVKVQYKITQINSKDLDLSFSGT